MIVLRTTNDEGGQQILETWRGGKCENCGKHNKEVWIAFNDQRSEQFCQPCVDELAEEQNGEVEVIEVIDRADAAILAEQAYHTWS